MKPIIFVDGSEGTTGLEINERLAKRPELDVRAIDPERRKDPAARQQMIRQADLVFLCLPDAASKEAVAMAGDISKVRFIDASTAHRTAPGWVYGLPELAQGKQREAIRKATRVANPGCHATGFNLIVEPLVRLGVVPADTVLTCTSITGFSGGGKKMIASYAAEPAPIAARQSKETSRDERIAPRPYALGLTHKHLPEMQTICGLAQPPIFMPIVSDFYRGMAVCVPLASRQLRRPMSAGDIALALKESYAGETFVRVSGPNDAADVEEGLLRTLSCNGTNRCELSIFGNNDQTLIIARLDNLGKGASGAAIQCMNLMLGFDEGTSLQS